MDTKMFSNTNKKSIICVYILQEKKPRKFYNGISEITKEKKEAHTC